MRKTELAGELITAVEKHRISNHCRFDKSLEIAIIELQDLRAPSGGRKLLTKSEWLSTLRRNLPFWKRMAL
jgi:hypothetical protein